VTAALPGARIVEFTVPEPSYAMVTNRRVIHAFRDELQKLLSQLEATTTQAIHVFAALPAALAIEFGALLTTQHQHPYIIFDRDKNNANQFRPMLSIGCTEEQRP
ncbi:TPA: SAVED domain-containing protein, partial [Klebsiella pneumoniae]|nr:SAVED domain-containing protein [Klebsiella pneumoniae]